MQERSHRQLPQWQHAMELGVKVYHEVNNLSEDDRDRVLIEELMKSAMRIATAISEGFDEQDNLYFRRYLRRARGACYRLATSAELCERLELGGDWNGVIVSVNDLRREIEELIASLAQA